MIKEKLVSLTPPAVPLWAITGDGSFPVITLALVHRETQSSADGSRYEVRPLIFVEDRGLTDWDEYLGDVLGYSLTPLNTDEIKVRFAREIVRMERLEARRIEELRKTKAEIRERRLRDGLPIPKYLWTQEEKEHAVIKG